MRRLLSILLASVKRFSEESNFLNVFFGLVSGGTMRNLKIIQNSEKSWFRFWFKFAASGIIFDLKLFDDVSLGTLKLFDDVSPGTM